MAKRKYAGTVKSPFGTATTTKKFPTCGEAILEANRLRDQMRKDFDGDLKVSATARSLGEMQPIGCTEKSPEEGGSDMSFEKDERVLHTRAVADLSEVVPLPFGNPGDGGVFAGELSLRNSNESDLAMIEGMDKPWNQDEHAETLIQMLKIEELCESPVDGGEDVVLDDDAFDRITDRILDETEKFRAGGVYTVDVYKDGTVSVATERDLPAHVEGGILVAAERVAEGILDLPADPAILKQYVAEQIKRAVVVAMDEVADRILNR